MVSLWSLLCVLGVASALTTLYVDNQSSSPSPVGSAEAPFSDLTQALLSTAALQVAIQFPTLVSSLSYTLQTLGSHQEVQLNCSGNAVKALYPVVVGPGVVSAFRNCHFSTDLTTGALMVVLGGLTVSGGSVRNVRCKGFALYGSIRLSDVTVTGNKDSIFAVQSFGFTLVVERCVFQGNTSPVGVVLLLGLSGTNPDSTTVLRVEDCTIVGNGAFQGGSFVYLSVSPEFKFSPAQLGQTRSLLVQRSGFNTNPGYLCILYSKFLNITFHSNVYQNHQYGFLLKLLGGAVTVSNSTLAVMKRCVIVTYLVGSISLQGLNITNVTEGPAILIKNSADQSLGNIDVSQVQMRYFTLLNTALFSSTIFAFNVRITVSDLRTSEGWSFNCGLGCFIFSSFQIRGAWADKVVVNQAISVGVLASSGTVTDLTLTNSTATGVGFCGVFISTAVFRNLHFDAGIGSHLARANTNMLIMFDSTVKVYNAYFNVPPLPSQVAFYVWNSIGEVYNLTFPRLYANVIDVFSGSFYISNMTILTGAFHYLAHISFYVNVTFEDVFMNNTVVESLFSALSGSTITARRMTIANLTLEGLVLSASSTFDLSSISLTNVYADTLFWYCSSSYIQVTNFRVVNSTFDLTQYLAGTLIFRQVVFVDVKVRQRFITANKATIIFDGFELNGLEATTVTPLATLRHGSSLTFRNTHIRNLRSIEQNLIHMSDSTFVLELSSLSDFNVTFLDGIQSNVYISDSMIYEGGLKLMNKDTKARVTAGLLDCVDSRIFLLRSHFKGLSGTDGGVVSLTKGSTVDIESCVFEDCFATKDGGAVHAIASSVYISRSTFLLNVADRGAGLYFECLDSSACSSEMTFSHFANNSAREGAGVKWTLVRPYFSNNTSAYNRAVYGEFEASVPTHMVLANSNDSKMTGVPGVVVVEPILIAFMDLIGQVVATDHSSIANITTGKLIGTTYLIAKDGISNFSSVIVLTTPGSSFQTDVFSPTINATYPGSPGSYYSFTYQTRVCIPGEVTSSTSCYLCPKNTFSVDPTESECRPCPSSATCPGGSVLLLNQGYWRISELSSVVYTCPILSACLGGQNSTCEEGYADRLCSRCVEEYYTAGLTYCVQCEAVEVRGFRMAIYLLVLMVIFVLVIRKSTAAAPSSASVSILTTIKILFNFLQSVLMISLINVDWKVQMMGLFSANEMFVSLALSSFTLECFERK